MSEGRPQQLKVLDESFWQDHEARLRNNLGQPCCTLSGISTGLIQMPGDFAVVIHGEHECAACFHHEGASMHRFFCVGLNEDDFTGGETREKLTECLRLVATEVKPSVIFVLGACPVEVIGDRFEITVAKLEEETGVPMRALHTSGLKVGTQAAMLDWMWQTLAALPPLPEDQMKWVNGPAYCGDGDGDFRNDARRAPNLERSMNLIGLPEVRRGTPPEWMEILQALELDVISTVPFGADLDVWRSMPHARKSFVADKRLYPQLFEVLESHGQEIIEVPLPVGVNQTRKFYETICEAFGVPLSRLDAVIGERQAAAQSALDAFKIRVANIRMAMGIRMYNNYRADQLAYEGLGDVEALDEMGFDLTILVQGPPEERMRIRFAETFEYLGCTLPFDIFPEPWGLAKRLKEGGFDAAYLADHCRIEAREADVPMVPLRTLQPYFAGVENNLIRMGKTLEEVLEI